MMFFRKLHEKELARCFNAPWKPKSPITSNRYADLLTEDDRKAVVRNGSAPERTILTGVGPVKVQRSRVDEREAVKGNPEHKRFTSSVLPRFLRRTPTIEGVVATLYLKGISTNDFDVALQAIYGEDAYQEQSVKPHNRLFWSGLFTAW